MTLLAATSCDPEDNDRGTEACLSQLTCPLGWMPAAGNTKLKIQWENIFFKKTNNPVGFSQLLKLRGVLFSLIVRVCEFKT